MFKNKINEIFNYFEGYWTDISSVQKIPLLKTPDYYFLNKLKKVEKYCGKHNFIDIIPEEKCLLCDKYAYHDGFNLRNIHWKKGYVHYLKDHLLKPTMSFKNMINSMSLHDNYIYNLPILKNVDQKTMYVRVNENQLHIMDALFDDGSKRKYISFKKNTEYLYSEHTGILHISEFGLDKIIVSVNTSRISDTDASIYLPNNDMDNYKYEYMFHTHPKTPYYGSRIKDSVLYEFPSISDIYNFIENYNYGITIGSIVISPEGIYIIHRDILDKKKINTSKYAEITPVLTRCMFNIQKSAILKYRKLIKKNRISSDDFFNIVAQDTESIEKYNKCLKYMHVQIDFYPRIKINRKWILGPLILPLYLPLD